ncbi:hypothetical protein NF681_01010 (plasmid) [Comamonadaceae bacterium OTU4NAUVB1]|nr:hypothetical protein NF681_01010 [Comamonadaceae bacterium OTU4NAUVB1]
MTPLTETKVQAIARDARASSNANDGFVGPKAFLRSGAHGALKRHIA